MIDQKTIEDIRFKADIVDIIGRYVVLKKKGRNHTGLCPFHQEKTPSFMVSPEKNIWHCFGCHKGGNVFNFLMEIEKLDFIEAVKMLAEITGVEIKEEDHQIQKQDKEEKNTLYAINEKAKNFFQEKMQENAQIQRYIQSRNLSPEIVKKFELGYAPDSWNALLNNLQSYPAEKLADAGLVIKKENVREFYDRFRHRLVFPIRDIKEKIIGFSGRIIEADPDKSQAKYVNTPDTMIFNKGNNLYGLYLAKQKIKETNTVLLVEGQMDVIACHAAGLTNTVASLGTAFTANQARLLSRYTKNVVIAYDADEAGQNAAERVIEILEPLEFTIKICNLAEKDLDELLQKSGPAALAQAVESAKHYLEYKLDRICAKYNVTDIAERSLAARECARIIKNVKDRVQAEHYMSLVSRKLNVSSEILKEDIYTKRVILPFAIGKKAYSEYQQPRHKYEKAEKALIKMLLNDSALTTSVFEVLTIGDFSQEWQELVNYLNTNKKTFDDIVADSDLSVDLRKKVAEIAMHSDEEKHFSFSDALQLMQEKNKQQKRQHLRIALLDAEKTGNEEKANEILAQLQSMR